jgi:hypothetical protein
MLYHSLNNSGEGEPKLLLFDIIVLYSLPVDKGMCAKFHPNYQ